LFTGAGSTASKEIESSASHLKTGDRISFPAEYCCSTYHHHAIVLAVKRYNTINIIHATTKAKKGESCKGLRGYEVREQEIRVDALSSFRVKLKIPDLAFGFDHDLITERAGALQVSSKQMQ